MFFRIGQPLHWKKTGIEITSRSRMNPDAIRLRGVVLLQPRIVVSSKGSDPASEVMVHDTRITGRPLIPKSIQDDGPPAIRFNRL